MGRGFVTYQLSESRREEWVLFSAFISYRLSDGTMLDVDQEPAWCPACDRFVIAERIPQLNELHEEIGRFRGSDFETLQRWAFVSNDAPVETRIQELSRRVGWRRERKSPPRCLECGDIGIVPIPLTDEFDHPGTGEKVKVIDNGFADTDRWVAEFSPDGLPLTEKGTDEG